MRRSIGHHFWARHVILLASIAVLALAQTPPAANPDIVVVAEPTARNLIKHMVDPEYPATARQFRMGGVVMASITIGTDGKVESVAEIKGNQILQGSVRSALQKWLFSPYMRDGKPVRMRTTLSFMFTVRGS